MHVVAQVELYVHALNTSAFDIFGRRFYFDAFSTVHTNRIYVLFRFDPLSNAFSNRCVFDENAHARRISVDGRPKRIEMYTF